MENRDRSFWDRHYAVLALAVLCLAAFNLTFRLGSEIVTEWDESLYAISAWEMLHSGNWIGTTFLGSLDYYNTKPPLNVWLIALAFKALGPSLLSLRIWSICAAWTTVAVFQRWVRLTLGKPVALAASLVLSTTFGFIYDHSGRSGNTDALFTLLILLTVVTLWAAQDDDWRVVWLGPIAAAVFLLRGMAVLMPLAIVAAVEFWRATHRQRRRFVPLAAAFVVFLIPTLAWLVARWRLDQWRFISRIVTYDFAARTLTVIEGHPGTPFYYFNILHRNQFDWVVAGLFAWLMGALPWRKAMAGLAVWRTSDQTRMLIATWGVISFLVPTIMRTKLSWYLNPFYPPFALGVAWLFVRGAAAGGRLPLQRRVVVLTLIFGITLGAAEGRLLWYSVHRRAIANSPQGLLLAERRVLNGQKVFRDHWTHSEMFVLQGIVGAEHLEAATVADFFRDSRAGDFLFVSTDIAQDNMQLVGINGCHRLFRRLE